MQRQSKLVVPILTSFTKNEKKRAKLKEKLKAVFEMNDETADRFIGCFSIFDPVTIKTNTILICSPGFRMTSMWSTRRFISYMPIRWERNISNGIKSISRDPDIREFDMQHEQWLFGRERYTAPVLAAIDDFMEMPV